MAINNPNEQSFSFTHTHTYTVIPLTHRQHRGLKVSTLQTVQNPHYNWTGGPPYLWFHIHRVNQPWNMW